MSITQYWLDLDLVTDSPLHSGGMDEDVDRSVVKDGEDRECVTRKFVRTVDGRAVLTGRSIKGALRDMLRHVADKSGTSPSELDKLWGSLERGSALTVHPIELDEVEDRFVERFGIAIDRRWGAVGAGALFRHEVVPQGTPLRLSITARAESDAADDTKPIDATCADEVERLFAWIVAALRAGHLALGGRRSVGWGRVRLAEGDDAVSVRKAVLDSRAGLVAFHRGGELFELDSEPDLTARSVVTATLEWESPTGILVASGEADTDPAENKPQVTKPLRCGGEGSLFVLPGSSVRGSLRNRCSWIARTVLKHQGATLEDWSQMRVHDQLLDDSPLVRALFGDVERRGAVTVLDTLADGTQESTIITHNAGDRFTGGAADGLLYKEESVTGRWKNIILEVDPDLLALGAKEGEETQQVKAGLCLLGLALAELATGVVRLGSRGTRGLGEARLTGLRLDGPEELLGRSWDLRAPANEPEQMAEQILAELRELNKSLPEGGWTNYLEVR